MALSLVGSPADYIEEYHCMRLETLRLWEQLRGASPAQRKAILDEITGTYQAMARLAVAFLRQAARERA